MLTPSHNVSIVVDGREVRGWSEYSIATSIVDPVGHFTLSMPWSREAWDSLRPDRSVRLTIDGTTVLRGLIDERDSTMEEDLISINGRDRVGRLVQESSPGFAYQGVSLLQLIQEVAGPWFSKVTLSNARNRRVIRGKGRKAAVGDEPLKFDPQKLGWRHEPGQTRWEIIQRVLEQTGMLAWSSGDGTELVVGRPNYDQEPQWIFFRPKPGSARSKEGNASIGVKDSVADRYSKVIVVSQGHGTLAKYGIQASRLTGQALDNPADPDGVGLDFSEPKRLIFNTPADSREDAGLIADRELKRRKAHGEVISVRTWGHGQYVGGRAITIFAPDTIARVECERTGRRGAYLVTGCRYTSNRSSGEQTELDLVPIGTELKS